MNHLSMSAFDAVRTANNNQRFCIGHDKAGTATGVQVAKEGFFGRVLSFLGILTSEVKAQNKEALETFARAISGSDSRKMESIIRDCLDKAGATPLTSRTIQKVEEYSQRYDKMNDLTRFKDIKVKSETQVSLGDGRPMPVNKVSVGGTPVALAGSYPKGSPEALGAHLRMLVEQNCSSLVVLAGNDQVFDGKDGLPPYFKGEHQYGDVSVKSKFVKRTSIKEGDLVEPQYVMAYPRDKPYTVLEGPLVVEQHLLTINFDGRSFSLPVVHATNWPDHGILKDSTQLAKLTELVANVNKGESGLPMIHCKGGVGRTGTLIASLQLINNPFADVTSIIGDMKKSRNDKMCEDKCQQFQLKQMAERLKVEGSIDAHSPHSASQSDDDNLYANSSGYRSDDLYVNSSGYRSDDLYVNSSGYRSDDGYVNSSEYRTRW